MVNATVQMAATNGPATTEVSLLNDTALTGVARSFCPEGPTYRSALDLLTVSALGSRVGWTPARNKERKTNVQVGSI